jgi:hypothetical protein
VTTESLPQHLRETERRDPEDHARLLEAAKAALRYLDDLDAHAPEGFHFGGEAKIRRQLRQAIRAAGS